MHAPSITRRALLALVATLSLVASVPESVAGQSPLTTFSMNPGGSRVAFNVTAIGQVKNSTGKLRKLIVQTAASAGTLTINDMASGGTPAAGNQVAAIPFGQLTAGAIITLDAPFASGIAISGTWPTGLVLVVTYD